MAPPHAVGPRPPPVEGGSYRCHLPPEGVFAGSEKMSKVWGRLLLGVLPPPTPRRTRYQNGTSRTLPAQKGCPGPQLCNCWGQAHMPPPATPRTGQGSHLRAALLLSPCGRFSMAANYVAPLPWRGGFFPLLFTWDGPASALTQGSGGDTLSLQGHMVKSFADTGWCPCNAPFQKPGTRLPAAQDTRGIRGGGQLPLGAAGPPRANSHPGHPAPGLQRAAAPADVHPQWGSEAGPPRRVQSTRKRKITNCSFKPVNFLMVSCTAIPISSKFHLW